jgi:hypothetical protein
MPVSLAALPTLRKLAEGQDKASGAPDEPALRSGTG